MPKTASASVRPKTWAIPQSSRMIVTWRAQPSQRATSGAGTPGGEATTAASTSSTHHPRESAAPAPVGAAVVSFERKPVMPVQPDRPIAIYHEHPTWFRPLFAELELRGVPYARLDAARHRYEPGASRPPYALLFNRMSPSAWRRGVGHGIFY